VDFIIDLLMGWPGAILMLGLPCAAAVLWISALAERTGGTILKLASPVILLLVIVVMGWLSMSMEPNVLNALSLVALCVYFAASALAADTAVRSRATMTSRGFRSGVICMMASVVLASLRVFLRW